MKKRGFTLIELLAVIVILGVLALIAVPVIDGAIKNMRENSYQQQIANIETAAKMWANENIYDLPTEENPVKTLTLEFLIQNGYVEKTIENPKTGEPFENLVVVVTYEDGGLSYEVLINNTPVGMQPDGYQENTPSIIMNGSPLIYVGIGEIFTDPGVVAKDQSGTSLSYTTTFIKADVQVSSIDTNTAGTYYIQYTVSSNGSTNTAIRTVIVK